MGLPLECPAATEVHPPADVPSVICGVLALSNVGAHAHGFQSRGQVDPLISGAKDPNVVRFQCAGQGVPGSPMSYCACALWRAEKERIAAGRDELRDEQAHRPPTSRPTSRSEGLREVSQMASRNQGVL